MTEPTADEPRSIRAPRGKRKRRLGRRPNRTGSVSRTAGGKKRVQVRIGNSRVSAVGRTEQEALANVDAKVRALDGDAVGARSCTVREMLEKWNASRVVSLATQHLHDTQVAGILRIVDGDLPIGQVTDVTVTEWLNGFVNAGLAPSTRRQAAFVLNGAFKRAVRGRLIPANPRAGQMPRNVGHRVPPPLSMEDRSRLLKGIRGHRYELAYGLALSAGMREGEILALKGEDFDLERREVRVRCTVTTDKLGRPYIGEVPKTPAGERTVPLEGIAWGVVRRRAPSAGLCFSSPTSRSGVVWGSTLWRAFQKCLVAAGLPRRRFHDLRHYFATGVVAAKGPLPALSQKLGHKNQTFTGDVYVDVSPEMMKAIPDAVDELFGDGTQAPWPGAFNGG